MTVTEMKRALLAEHARHGFFPPEVVKSIIKEGLQLDARSIDVICCMLELVYSDKDKEI